MTRKRARRTRDEWRALVSEVECSGQTMSAYSRTHGVSLASLSYWKKKLGSTAALGRPGPKAKAVFSEVVVVPRVAAQPSRIEVVTRNGAAIRIEGAFDARVLREVLRVVESC
jgi:transposase-like protein